jgi:hypothetical protein
MKRTAGAMMLLAALGGCISTEHKPSMADSNNPASGNGHLTIPNAVGPWGQPVPYNPARAAGAPAPADGVVTAGYASGIDNLKGTGTDNGLVKTSYNPALPMPAVAGMNGMGACVANAGGGMMGPMAPINKRTEVRFVGPNGMKISWYVPSADGKGAFSPNYLTAPARYNFLQGALYRLKLSDIANRPGLELYPTLEVVPSGPRSDAFLAHSAVPITITDEDLDQVATGNFVVKVIYLPDPQYQDLATVGPDEVVSSRLEPGVDPLVEAHRRGNILLVVRLGNIDLEAPNTPAMDAPIPGAPKVGMMRAPAGPRMMTADPKAAANATSMSVKPTAALTIDASAGSMDSKPGTANASSAGRSSMSSTRPDVKVDASQANWWTTPNSTKQ